MELQEYWRRAGRRRWILLVLPALAAVAALPVAMAQSPRYTATATITLLSNEIAPTPPGVNQVVSDYQSLLSAQTVLDRISSRTGEPVGTLQSDLTVKQVGAGDLAELSYTSTDPRKAVGVVTAAGSIAYDTLYASRVATAEQQLRFAQQYDQQAQAAQGSQADSSGGATQDEQQAAAVVGQAQQQLNLMKGLQAYGGSGAITTSAAHELPLLHDRIETMARAVLIAVLLAAGALTVVELVRATPWSRSVAGDSPASSHNGSAAPPHPAGVTRVRLHDGQH